MNLRRHLSARIPLAVSVLVGLASFLGWYGPNWP